MRPLQNTFYPENSQSTRHSGAGRNPSAKIQEFDFKIVLCEVWIPACAGMTKFGRFVMLQ